MSANMQKSAYPVQRFETVQDMDEAASGVPFSVGSAQTIGLRDAQEDSFLVSDLDKQDYHTGGILAVVADGVGGLGNGQVASSAAVRAICTCYAQQDKRNEGDGVLLELLAAAHSEVRRVVQSGVKCASTLVCAFVKDMQLHFLSVGDSRIYLCRAGGLISLTREHVLSRTADEGEALGRPGAAVPPARRKAITSYLGKEDLTQIDRNITPIRLQAGDRVMVMSDGVFGTLTDDQIISCITGTAQETAEAVIRAVDAARQPAQDNATCVVITCKDSNE